MIFKNDTTIGEVASAVLAIKNAEEAKAFYDEYVEYISISMRTTTTYAEKIVKQNIGWFFGEGMTDEMMSMWHATVGAYHPVFGTTRPTPEEAFKLGMKMGERARRKSSE